MSESVEVSAEPNASDFTVILRPERNKYWSTPGLKIALKADRFARVIATRARKHLMNSIKLGLAPQGGSQKPLQSGTHRAKKANDGKRPRARGFTEHAIFVNSLIVHKLRSSKRHATYVVTTDKPEVFNEWVIQERARGVDWFPIHGEMGKVIKRAVEDVMDRAVRTANRGARRAAASTQDFRGSVIRAVGALAP